MLDHSLARSIAEAMWGRGGTHSTPTNRKGAYYFSCSGHGGFIISVDALTDEELLAISPYVNIEESQLYQYGRRTRFMHPYRRTGFRISMDAVVKTIKFIALEEDCCWCLAYTLTGIRHQHDPATLTAAQETFEQYFLKKVS